MQYMVCLASAVGVDGALEAGQCHRALPAAPSGRCQQRRNNSHAAGWSCGLMDKALVFGTKDCRFESCQDHDINIKRCFCTLGLHMQAWATCCGSSTRLSCYSPVNLGKQRPGDRSWLPPPQAGITRMPLRARAS